VIAAVHGPTLVFARVSRLLGLVLGLRCALFGDRIVARGAEHARDRFLFDAPALFRDEFGIGRRLHVRILTFLRDALATVFRRRWRRRRLDLGDLELGGLDFFFLRGLRRFRFRLFRGRDLGALFLLLRLR
jgi:hypothetical protein